MTYHALIAYSGNELELACPTENISEYRVLGGADFQRFAEWARVYRKNARYAADRLLQLGQEIFDWLNGPEQFLERSRGTATAPMLALFAAGSQDSSEARSFLDAPWELVAQDGQHWALQPELL